LTDVRNGTPSLIPARNQLRQNLFFSGSPFSIDCDDGSDQLDATQNVVYKRPLFKDDYGGHAQTYTKNVALFGGGCIHSNIAPRDPHGRERCHFSSPCADKDAATTFSDNHCVADTSAIRCTHCTPGVDCAVISANRYYSSTVNASGSLVCPSAANNSLEVGSTVFPIPSDEALLQLCKGTLGMVGATEDFAVIGMDDLVRLGKEARRRLSTKTDDSHAKPVLSRAANSEVLGVAQDPLAPPAEDPLGSSPDRERAIENAPALVPGSLARLWDPPLLTGLSPQVLSLNGLTVPLDSTFPRAASYSFGGQTFPGFVSEPGLAELGLAAPSAAVCKDATSYCPQLANGYQGCLLSYQAPYCYQNSCCQGC
jgi:hypothetical protein